MQQEDAAPGDPPGVRHLSGSMQDLARFLFAGDAPDGAVAIEPVEELRVCDLFANLYDLLVKGLVLRAGGGEGGSVAVDALELSDLAFVRGRLRLAGVDVVLRAQPHEFERPTVRVADAARLEGHVLHLRVREAPMTLHFELLPEN
jgi:hypothetical protein